MIVTGLPRRGGRHRWEVTDHAVYVWDGVLVEDWRGAPLSRARS